MASQPVPSSHTWLLLHTFHTRLLHHTLSLHVGLLFDDGWHVVIIAIIHKYWNLSWKGLNWIVRQC